MHRARTIVRTAVATLAALALTACGGGAAPAQQQDVTELTVWARGNAIGENLFRPLVEAWNADHDVKVQLTLIPSAELTAKIGAAAGANQLPDVIISDVGNVPKLVDQGLLTDLTDRARALPYVDALAPSHLQAGSDGDRLYAVPADVDPSVMFVNTTLLTKAGVATTPTSLTEVADAAEKVTALGGEDRGFYIAGSCGGCLAFTVAPSVWAGGGEVFADEGATVTLDTPAMKQTLEQYRRIWQSGAVPPDARADTGANWSNVFAPGNVGVQFNGSGLLSALIRQDPGFDWDVRGIPGPSGGESSFVGGDVFTVTKDARNVDRAWEFISWALDEQQQVDLYARAGWLTVRSDLTDNRYTAADPRVKKVNDLIGVGRLPRSSFNAQIFNDPTGPWLAAFRKAVFDGDIDGGLREGQQQAQQIIDQG